MQGKINAGMVRESESQDKVGYKSVIDLGREAAVPFPHNLYDYPTKILPQVMGEFVERLSNAGEVVLDPFAGGGTIAVECALRQRRSINVDINPYALQVAQKKLEALRIGSLFESPLVEGQMCLLADARALPLKSDSIDAIVTDIPYADMIRYSDLPADLSTIEDYDAFLDALGIAFDEMARVLKPNRYCAIFVADYRIARSRVILPLHADVIALMQQRGFDLFDLYVWRYYRSGGFRPFGAKPYQAMNVHSYILVFHKPVAPKTLVKNRPVRYLPRLIKKLHLFASIRATWMTTQCMWTSRMRGDSVRSSFGKSTAKAESEALIPFCLKKLKKCDACSNGSNKRRGVQPFSSFQLQIPYTPPLEVVVESPRIFRYSVQDANNTLQLTLWNG